MGSSIFGGIDKKKLNRELFAKIAENVVELTEKDVQLATLAVHNKAVKSIQANSGGETVKRYKPYRYVKAAPPGSAPNTDTGRLVQSILFEFDKTDGVFSGYVGTNLKYGAMLEFGTSNMKARPWLAPAMREGTKAFIKSLANRLKKQLQKKGN